MLYVPCPFLGPSPLFSQIVESRATPRRSHRCSGETGVPSISVLYIGLGLGGCVLGAVIGVVVVAVSGIIAGPASPHPFDVGCGMGEEPGVFWVADLGG